MEKQFVTYEIALRLKELGFDESCFGYYPKQVDAVPSLCVYQEESYFLIGDEPPIDRIEAPLWQQAIDWLREKDDLNVEINYFPNIKKYGLIISRRDFIPKNHNKKENFQRGYDVTSSFITFETYDDARKQSILNALELLKLPK